MALSGKSLHAAIWFLSLNWLAFSGDPCPSKSELSLCTCSQVEVKQSLLSDEPFQEYQTTLLPTPVHPRLRRSLAKRKSNNELEVQAGKLLGNTSYYTSVECKAPKSLLALEESIQNGLFRKSVDRLIVSNVPSEKQRTLVRLPKGWLKYVRVKQFEVRDTVLSGDFIHFGNPLEGQEQSMVSFTASKCYLYGSLTFDTYGTINTKGLNTLPYLEVINLSKNHLVYLTNLAFRYPPANLTTINVSYNSIQAIEGSVFNYAPKLKTLDISHNLVETITRSMFPSPARAIEDINLSWNNIKAIPVDMFSNMPALKSVNLAHNFLYSLPARPWSVVWKQLKFIELRGNFLECNCDLLWLLNVLSPTKVNVTTTPAPTTLPGQTLLGTCDYTDPQMYAKTYQLAQLTKKNLNCNA